MATSKSTWTGFERTVAAIFGSKRNPLSGANSRQDNGEPRGGDVILPSESPYLVECKLRAKFAHHALFRAAKADAKKHGKPHAILFTKQKGERSFLVIIDADLFNDLYEKKR